MLCLSAVVAILVYALSSVPANCHIHPPGEVTKEERKYVIGPYPSAEACEAENNKQFGGTGRCHCLSVGFSAGTPMEPVFPKPFESLPEDTP
jgi:hypothetical protein